MLSANYHTGRSEMYGELMNFMITVLDLTAAGERAHLFPLFTTSIPQISVWSAVRYLQ